MELAGRFPLERGKMSSSHAVPCILMDAGLFCFFFLFFFIIIIIITIIVDVIIMVAFFCSGMFIIGCFLSLIGFALQVFCGFCIVVVTWLLLERYKIVLCSWFSLG